MNTSSIMKEICKERNYLKHTFGFYVHVKKKRNQQCQNKFKLPSQSDPHGLDLIELEINYKSN